MMTRSLMSLNETEKNRYLLSSLNFFNDAIRLCPVQSNYYTKRFICLNRLNLDKDALVSLKEAIRYSPMSPYNYYYLGDFYLENRFISKASIAYSKHYKLSDRHFELTLDKIIRFSDDYDTLKLIVPDRIDLKKRFARYLFSKGMHKEAIYELHNVYLAGHCLWFGATL